MTHPTMQNAPQRHMAIIVSRGGLDEVYPALILGNAARMAGIECTLFFTFYGLMAIHDKKVDHLHVNMAGNAASPMPTMLAGLPGMENFAAKMMLKQMAELDLPGPREMIEMLSDSGAHIFACELAMTMFKLEKSDLLPQVEDVITAGDFYDMTYGAQVLFT